jgi:hypothetical protein
MDVQDEFSFLAAAQSQGLNLKVYASNFYANGYLTGTTKSLVDGAYVTAIYQPGQIPSPAITAEENVLQTYAHIIAKPDALLSEGYATGLLLVQALQDAGPNPSRSTLMSTLRNTTNWTAGGLLPVPADLSKEISDPPHFQANNCGWIMHIEGSNFVPMSTQPVCAGPTILGS